MLIFFLCGMMSIPEWSIWETWQNFSLYWGGHACWSSIGQVHFVSNTWLLLTLIVHVFRPNSFVIITANRVIHCNSDTPEEMHHWISLLQKPKGDARIDGQEFLVRGEGFGYFQTYRCNSVLSIFYYFFFFYFWEYFKQENIGPFIDVRTIRIICI